MKNLLILSTLFLSALATPVFAQMPMDTHSEHATMTMSAHAEPMVAIAVFTATKGYDTKGTVKFEKIENGVRISGRIENLTPGKHGFHVHQYGDLSKDDGTAAGGHFNPAMTDHAGLEDPVRHAGDMGNVVANADGVAEFSFVDNEMTFTGPASIIGRGLIVHAGQDDLVSQPSGAAGPRAGMAVIGWADPKD